MSDTIDVATFQALQESTGADFVVELVATFIEEAPTMLGELHRALADGNAEQFRRAAHSLKSNANTFGALALATLARELELGGLARAGAPDALAALDAEYARVAARLQELAHG
jgi:HPt (histidine-containing phosphotransfer) domain-containing protein